MSKITLTDLVNLENQTTAVNAINSNNQTLETAVDNTLSRDGTSPNTMGAVIDMNSNKIINLAAPANANDAVRLQDIVSTSTILPATALPLVESGIGVVGSGLKYAREDHVHPAAPGSTMTIGTSPITSGTTTRVLFDNAGILGEYPIVGTGSVVLNNNSTHTGTFNLTNNQNSSSQLSITNTTNGASAFTYFNAINDLGGTLYGSAASTNSTAAFQGRGLLLTGSSLLGLVVGNQANTPIIFYQNGEVARFDTSNRLQLSGALIYGGVTLSNSVTGTGSMVLSATPTFTGTPAAPTAAVDTSTTQLATTAYVVNQASASSPLTNGVAAVIGTSTRFARADHVHPGRELVLANRTYFVRSDGSDSNTGLANTAGGAFLTYAKAVSTVVALDFNGFTITVTNGNAATFTTGISMTGGWQGSGNLVFDLGGGTLNVAGNCFLLFGFAFNGTITIQNGTIKGGSGIVHSASGTIQLGTGLIFDTCTGRHMVCTQAGAYISGTAVSYSIKGGADAHMYAADQGRIDCGLATGTFTGNAAFGTTGANTGAFACAGHGGIVIAGSGSYPVGAFTITGRRYNVTLGGQIDTGGGAAVAQGSAPNYFPGTAAGGAGVGTLYSVSPYGFYNG